MKSKPSTIPLPIANVMIRQGDMSLDLLATVQKRAVAWRGQGEPELAAFVAAEVFDHFGMYRESQDALAAYDETDLLDDLRHTVGKKVVTKRLWLLLAIAQVHYRAERYKDSARCLQICQESLDNADPVRRMHFGTRARVAFALGQTTRQLGRYDAALTHYTDAIGLAQHRFRENTPSAEMTEMASAAQALDGAEGDPQFAATRRLAHWTIAKCLVLGIGWIKYVTGELRDASVHLCTAAALLRTTSDGVHRAYCQLLMAGAERARFGADPIRIGAALKSLNEAATGLAAHPLFSNRAHHELAVAYLHVGDLKHAERHIDAFSRSPHRRTGAESRSTRWTCYALILRSRLARKMGQIPAAVHLAHEALTLARAQGTRLEHCEVDALIAHAEALKESGLVVDRERAVFQLTEARLLSGANPKFAAVTTVHLAAVLADLGRMDLARAEMNRWHYEYEGRVEHEFVRRLANDVSSRIWPNRENFVIEGENMDENVRRLKLMLLGRVRNAGSRIDQANRLGFEGTAEAKRKRLRDEEERLNRER